jgi:hypothetical protein
METGRFFGTRPVRKFLLNMSIQETGMPVVNWVRRHDLDPFSHHLQSSQRNMTLGKRKMPRTKKSDAGRASAQSPDLVKQYRAIGPAVLVAALICAPKKRNKIATRNVKAA